jgi:hypothetical protein
MAVFTRAITGLYTAPAESNPHPHNHITLRSILILSSQLCFLYSFSVSTTRVIYSVHHILHYHPQQDAWYRVQTLRPNCLHPRVPFSHRSYFLSTFFSYSQHLSSSKVKDTVPSSYEIMGIMTVVYLNCLVSYTED